MTTDKPVTTSPAPVYGVLHGYMASLNVTDFPLHSECRPLFDLTESSLRTMCDFALLFSSSGVALVVGPNKEVAIAQAVPVLNLEAVFSELVKIDAGWQQEGEMLYSMSGSSAKAAKAIKKSTIDIQATEDIKCLAQTAA
jgi:hypothetical protein